jgi:hypothetical protein
MSRIRLPRVELADIPRYRPEQRAKRRIYPVPKQCGGEEYLNQFSPSCSVPLIC